MRCKVACSLKQPYEDGFCLSFFPVYIGSPENEQFFKCTPGGSLTFNVLNTAAAEKFEVGKEYYLDFTPA
jgi:hypothetical protein